MHLCLYVILLCILIALACDTDAFLSDRPINLKPHERRDPKEWVSRNITFGLKREARAKPKTDEGCSTKLSSKNSFTTMNWKYLEEDLNITPSPAIQDGTITQHLDHFSKTDNRTFSQRYIYNTEFATNDSVNFLKFGGEGAIQDGDLESVYMALAKEFGANLYLLEHRYYGSSRPLRNQSEAYFKYLSSEQALADAAVFISTINTNHSITNPKWIVFGCSYAGNLAAWMRMKYPELVLGAVASSAPVEAKLDYKEYLKVIEKKLELHGSKNCTSDVRRFFSKVQVLLLTKEGRKRLGIEGNDTYDFIHDNFPWIQGDDFQHSAVKWECDSYKERADNISSSTVTTFRNIECHGKNTEQEINPWFWQKCTEFGYFHTTSIDGGIYDDAMLPVRDHIEHVCSRNFPEMHFNESNIQAAIDKTNSYYGGNKNFNATKVVFVNGSEDPWHPLSVYDTPNDSVKSILVQGASHCGDQRYRDIPEAMKNAHERVKLEVAHWLGLNQ